MVAEATGNCGIIEPPPAGGGVWVPVVATSGTQGTYWIAGDVTFGAVCVAVGGAAVAGDDPGFTGVITVAAWIVGAEIMTTSMRIGLKLYRRYFMAVLLRILFVSAIQTLPDLKKHIEGYTRFTLIDCASL